MHRAERQAAGRRPLRRQVHAAALRPALGRAGGGPSARSPALDAPQRGLGRPERVHYGPLDVEDLGRVYEALLELEPGIATEPMCRLRRRSWKSSCPLRRARSIGCRGSGIRSRTARIRVEKGRGRMAEVQSYRDLRVWQRAMDLVEECYRLTHHFPQNEMYGLTSQVRRAAVSIPANIAEGHGRSSLREYLHHLSIAHGSLMEVETHLQIAHRLHYLEEKQIQTALTMATETGKMLNGLMTSLKAKMTRPRSRHPLMAPGRVDRGDPAGAVSISRVGLGRKATGSFYTPHSFVRFLVQETLGPLVERAAARTTIRSRPRSWTSRCWTMPWGAATSWWRRALPGRQALRGVPRSATSARWRSERKAEQARSRGRAPGSAFAEAAAWRQRVAELPDPDDELVRYLPSQAPEGEESRPLPAQGAGPVQAAGGGALPLRRGQEPAGGGAGQAGAVDLESPRRGAAAHLPGSPPGRRRLAHRPLLRAPADLPGQPGSRWRTSSARACDDAFTAALGEALAPRARPGGQRRRRRWRRSRPSRPPRPAWIAPWPRSASSRPPGPAA